MSGGFMGLALTGGDWVIWGLLLCSVAAIAIIIERWILLKKEHGHFKGLRRQMLKNLDENPKDLEKLLKTHPGSSSRILQAGFSQAQHGAAGVEDLLVAASLDEKEFLERRLLVLGTLGNNAPFVGLFGTVLGVIKAFHDLAQSGAGPEVVMSGLSEALIATAVGLFVAIPCVVGFNYYSKQVKDLLAGTEALGRVLLAHVRAGKAR
jgi:biopolymer transport protein ExbB